MRIERTGLISEFKRGKFTAQADTAKPVEKLQELKPDPEIKIEEKEIVKPKLVDRGLTDIEGVSREEWIENCKSISPRDLVSILSSLLEKIKYYDSLTIDEIRSGKLENIPRKRAHCTSKIAVVFDELLERISPDCETGAVAFEMYNDLNNKKALNELFEIV
ncbi:MAG: hypothetical protein ABIH00_01165, partial [Armatimonadota bacterium]